jgi:prepilin-type N-terminal cleavage/methylation domain-containing protein
MQTAAESKTGNGFSLIEVLIALVIFATVILSIAMLMPQAGIEARKSEITSTMALMAQKKIEQLRSVTYDDADLAAGWHSEVAPTRYARQSAGSDQYMVRWNVLEDQPAIQMKTVDVQVTHSSFDAAGKPTGSVVKPLTFRTFVLDTGERSGGEDHGSGIP